ncbi:calcium-binding protein CML42-like [Malus sylvestris]|uniref:calcium-binding protein CML42-like n=1 Tax=Malus sylvestris TaxID=3752 RepID=UPI0021ABA777|nr:calcium-binding protein CML42-like [Malus sylvestris]
MGFAGLMMGWRSYAVSGTGVPSLKWHSRSFHLRCSSLNFLQLCRIFNMYDKNKDGFISFHEISQVLALLGLDTEIFDLRSMIKSFIQPLNDGLNFDDFVSLHQSLYDTYFNNNNGDEEASAAEESDLSEAFKVFDEDDDRYISAKELEMASYFFSSLLQLGFVLLLERSYY